ncbi:hypothetical protein QX776_17075 [Alteromonadaceae bacterium BrNp21-10]|nr:hypothetical protein [Alteromonadaceae bacterium BrNp21-10]
MLKHIGFIFLLTSFATNAAILVTDSEGILHGARKVEIADLGGYYNLDIVDGTCAEVFSGCDEASDFYYNSTFEGTRYINALFGAIIDDTIYDTDPDQINGCEYSSSCRINHPFINEDTGTLANVYRGNRSGDGADSGPYLDSNFSGYELSNRSNGTWAVWSKYSDVEVVVAPNGSFETEDISGWNVAGNGTVEVSDKGDGDTAAKMTIEDEDATENPVSFSTSIITPVSDFYLYFYYLFETDTGTLNISLDDVLLGSYGSNSDLVGHNTLGSIWIDDETLLGKKLDLKFDLFPGSPASVFIDDVSVTTEARSVSSPPMILLFLLGLIALQKKAIGKVV